MNLGWRVTATGLVLLATVLLALPARTTRSAGPNTTPAQEDLSVAQKVYVHVSDFQLFALGAAQPEKRTPSGNTGQKQPDLVFSPTDTPVMQAKRLTDYFANTLVQTLKRKGFMASRQAGRLAQNEVLLRGVFAEADGKNRIRRALLGGGSTGTKYLLYVGTFNLSVQDQPLYQLATVQEPDPHYGPVITLNAYIPLAKYELVKNPTESDVQKICDGIAGNLMALISKNAAAFSR
jgi:hypothetical protein